MQIDESANQAAGTVPSNEEHREVVMVLGLVGSNGGISKERQQQPAAVTAAPAPAPAASDWGTGSGSFKEQALPLGLRKRHDSMPLLNTPSHLEASAPQTPKSTWNGDGSCKENVLPLRLRKRQDTLPSRVSASSSSSSLDASIYQTPVSRVAAAAPASYDSYEEQRLPFRFRRSQGSLRAAAAAAAAAMTDDTEFAMTGVDDDGDNARLVSTSSSTVYKPFGSSPATARTLLPWNHGHGDGSDSGWSTVSRRSSTSVMSESGSSSHSELSSFFDYRPPPRAWWPESTMAAARGVYEEDDAYSDYASNARQSVMMRRMFHSVMHGVVLALQSLAALAVLSVFVWMTVWKNPDAEPAFWTWLWEMPSMAISSVLVLCVVTMITHEVRVLSAVALLYLQAAILFMTSVSVLIMWVSVAEQSGEVVQSILVGCCVFLWGMAALGFLRAVVIWRVTELEEDIAHHQGLLHDDMETYGTIASSG
ncbi:hypothetical protein PT974_03721 [Cladobotryum mycophilum]|uniref:Transmembrane protein n=1 Tax=Cladobotryum mycophilum TaxID=491253 RepID=A0ABR0ST35_9HYPO